MPTSLEQPIDVEPDLEASDELDDQLDAAYDEPEPVGAYRHRPAPRIAPLDDPRLRQISDPRLPRAAQTVKADDKGSWWTKPLTREQFDEAAAQLHGSNVSVPSANRILCFPI